jgi:hypothetical protein
MLIPVWYRHPRSKASRQSGRRIGLFTHARALGLAVAVVLASVGCGAREKVVYVDPIPPGGYVPIMRSTDPRVHRDGSHKPAADVQIGPAEGGSSSYTPIASSSGTLVHGSALQHAVASPVAIASKRATSSTSSHGTTASAGSHESAASASSHGPATSASPQIAAAPAGAHGVAASAPAPGVANVLRPAASPTPVARLSLGAMLGATAGTPIPNDILSVDEDRIDGQVTISGRIESIVGPMLKIQTPVGPQGVRLAERARVERDAMGSMADLKPGQFVGIIHLPSAPADAVRLYATNPSMPRPGIAPVVGSRNGQVTTYGSIVKLEFGGLLLNTGGQTTTVTLPSGVPILRPASGASDLAVGTQVLATGPVESDGSLVATAVRVTGESRSPTPTPRSGR